jgi:site-specific recombinase XerD
MGVDLVNVHQLLGHGSINMTMRYSHLAPEHRAKAVKVLDSGFRLRCFRFLMAFPDLTVQGR